MNTYSIGEVADRLNLTISTLRYYDKEGLLNNVERTSGGIRIFREDDIRHLNMLECLKKTGMSLKDIKTFFEWCEEGDSTIEKRYQMFLDRKKEIEKQMTELQNTMDLVNYKCEFYKAALETGTVHCPELGKISKKAAKNSAYIGKIVGED